MDIRDVSFRGAALRASQRPAEWFPHVAVAGRSNVGKSSLLNWLLQRRLARVAKAPGKTRTLNFYLVNGTFYLVDLPGYGYAKVGRQLREEWGQELARYLLEEQRVAGVGRKAPFAQIVSPLVCNPAQVSIDLQHGL